jgi:hypothetical protein
MWGIEPPTVQVKHQPPPTHYHPTQILMEQTVQTAQKQANHQTAAGKSSPMLTKEQTEQMLANQASARSRVGMVETPVPAFALHRQNRSKVRSVQQEEPGDYLEIGNTGYQTMLERPLPHFHPADNVMYGKQAAALTAFRKA